MYYRRNGLTFHWVGPQCTRPSPPMVAQYNAGVIRFVTHLNSEIQGRRHVHTVRVCAVLISKWQPSLAHGSKSVAGIGLKQRCWCYHRSMQFQEPLAQVVFFTVQASDLAAETCMQMSYVLGHQAIYRLLYDRKN